MSDSESPLDPSDWQQPDLLSYQLAVLSRLLERGSEAILARRYDLWLTECRMLGHLLAKSPRTVRDLADDMVMDKAPISRSASRLVDKGLLTRTADPKDGRSAVFALTAEGERVASAILKNAKFGQTRLLKQLSAEQGRVLVAAVTKLLDYAKTKPPPE